MIRRKLEQFYQKIAGNHPYFIPFSTLFLVVFTLILYFGFVEYKVNTHTLKDKFASETERVERSFVDIVKHTEFMMKVIISQIKTNPKNLEHINNIINKYSINPRLNNVLSWTTFSWLDSKHNKVIDSTSGLLTQAVNYSNREYAKNAKREPGKMHLGSPTFGFASQRYVIPAVLGIVEDYEYIGALNIAFDLANLSVTLSNQLKDQKVYLALLDNKLNIILQSPNSLIPTVNGINPKDVYQFIEENKINFETLSTRYSSNMLTDGNNHYLHKISGYPFIIYLHYDSSEVTEDFWKDITYRMVEITAISLVALIIIIAIYRRETVLRNNAEESSKVAVGALQAKTDFLAYTAHELRSPLGFIISGSEMMSNKMFGEISPQYLDYIHGINQSGKELLEFIDDLLDNMQIEKGSFVINEALTDTKSLILRAVKVNNIHYNNKINIETKFCDNLPMLMTDPKRLFQILNNIISNAIKYSPENTTLSIDVTFYKGQVIISFQDQGYGMYQDGSDESSMLSQAHKKDANVKSIGLGLPIVRNLLNLMGAKFFINSKINQGTKILIIFPKEKIKRLSADNE